jgi:hypothetical protein
MSRRIVQALVFSGALVLASTTSTFAIDAGVKGGTDGGLSASASVGGVRATVNAGANASVGAGATASRSGSSAGVSGSGAATASASASGGSGETGSGGSTSARAVPVGPVPILLPGLLNPSGKPVTQKKARVEFASLSASERAALKLRCKAVVFNPVAYDQGLIKLCQMVLRM